MDSESGMYQPSPGPRRPAPRSQNYPAHPDRDRNPWISWMGWGWGLGLIVGAIALIAGHRDATGFQSDPGLTGVQLFGAGLVGFASTLFVAWMVCNALTWAPAGEPGRREPSSSVE